MKKLTLLLMVLVLAATQAWALPVDATAARSLALDFMTGSSGLNPTSLPTSGGSGLQLLHAEVSSVNLALNAYYIYNTGDGFVIVAGDDRAEQILGYGDADLDMNDIPCGLQFMLDSYKEQIDYLLEHPGQVVETPSLNAPMLTATSVAPMLTAKFSQGKPYNNLVPTYNGSRCRAGCSCVALCQVMHYYKYPTIDVPKVPAYTTRTHDIYMPELPSDRFHWKYIKDSYKGSYTDDEAYSVAKLMKYAGQAMEMDYSPDGSGAAIFQIRDAAVLFGYDHNAKVLYKDLDNYTDAQWAAIIQAELNADRPVIMGALNETSFVGHAFVIDGYNASNNKYHINWGWGGSGNNYFALNAFNISNYKFNCSQQIIVGLERQDPEIVVEPKPLSYGTDAGPASLSFSTVAGSSKKAYIIVNGYALTGGLTVKLNNGGSSYTIDKTSITMSDAAYGTKVTVTYKPTEPGTNNASVTISGGGAPSKTVSLSGTASAYSTIITNPSTLSFSAATSETKTATFKVICSTAKSDLQLKLNNGGTIYSIDKTTISKNAAISGANVTVTYKPTEAGTSNASVTISGGGAEPETVSLSGTATKPVITVDPTSIYFSTTVGESKTATFTVTSSDDLVGDLSVKVRSLDTSVSIDKATISKNEAINGAVVTVTYNPTVGESRYTFIDVSGGGADTKSIDLTTHAYMPEITIEPDSLSFSTYVNNAVKKTFKVKGRRLTNDLSFAFSDTTGTYRIGSINTTIAGSHFTSNVEVVYNPAIAGTCNAILTVNCGNAEPKVIVLTGVAKELPNVSVDVNSLSFESTYTGYETSRTITITCPDLPDNLQLSLSNDGTGSFGLSKSVITPEAAATGSPVTVYFSPTTGGGKHAKLNISYDGCTVVTIPLRGVGIKSDGYIFASPTILSFETQVGTPVTQTFRVTFTAANGSIMISSVNGEGETTLDDEGSDDGSAFNAISSDLGLYRAIIPFEGEGVSRNKNWFVIPTDPFVPIFPPIKPVFTKRLVFTLTGDECFDITPESVYISSVPYTTYVTVTYNPDCVGDHEAVISIGLLLGSARPVNILLQGTATDQSNAVDSDIHGNNMPLMQATNVNELAAKTKVYTDGHSIIIESPVEQSAYISDISGRAMTVNLQTGRNEIPINASGVYVVRVREKSIKLVLK